MKASTTDSLGGFLDDGADVELLAEIVASKRIELSEKELLIQAQSLIEIGLTNENIGLLADLLQLHRVIENTKARKRLETWAKRVVIGYFFVVLLLVVASRNIFLRLFDVSDTFLITMLSTTTINIIALGLIVIRGHFLFEKSTGARLFTQIDKLPNRRRNGNQ